MKKINIVFTSLFAIAFLFAPIAIFAQDKDSVEEVIVTGSYLKGSAVDGASPVEVISRDTIENLGATTIADIIRNMAIASNKPFKIVLRFIFCPNPNFFQFQPLFHNRNNAIKRPKK